MMWENTVQQVFLGSAVTTDKEDTEVFEMFALTFMGPIACRKLKRFMSSGSIQKPKSWSSRHVTNRLTMLNCYLQFIPGTAAAFNKEELKDMLVDLHSPTYQHLMARANSDMDNQTYLQVALYSQNMSVFEEQFNKANTHKTHGNSEAKVHKARNKIRQHKHGENNCRKHPHGDHMRTDCNDNPKSKNYKGNACNMRNSRVKRRRVE